MTGTHLVFRTYDRAALDDQYDNSKAVGPEADACIAAYATRSAAARGRMRGHVDLAYADHPRARLDLFQPDRAADRADAPILVFIHGGYWRSMDKSRFSYLAADWIANGVAVAVVGYPLAPSATMDDIVTHIRLAVAWLARNGHRFGADGRRLFVAGHSAGGHLAAMMAATDWSAFDPAMPSRAVVGGCAVSGIFDLEPIRLCYLNADIRLDPASVLRNSPLRYDATHGGFTATPPLILAVGGDETDEFRRQQADFAARWRSIGLDVETFELPGRHHFTAVDALGDADDPLFRAVLRHLDRSPR